MKRAIYVGEPWGMIQYGSTGVVTEVAWYGHRKSCFTPDGPENVRYWANRTEIYIPSEDQQRHCPKPV